MCNQVANQELEEEVKWMSEDQKDLAERDKYCQAELMQKDDELKKKDEEIDMSGTDILLQYDAVNRQRAYIDSLHQLMQRCRGPMQRLMETSADERPQ